MNPTLQKLLKPFASLRITVTLLVIACILVLAGTTAQRDMGIQDVQHEFFHSWIAHIQFHYFQPSPKAGGSYIPGSFPLPGGFTLIFLLLINLLAAHTVRFKFNRRRVGVILIHLGLILLLVGEWITAHYAIESRMTINVGGQARYAEDIREAELAIIDPSPADHDNVVVIPQPNLQNSVRLGHAIYDSKLPLDVKVDRWYDNAVPHGPMEPGKGVERLATAGALQKVGLEGIDKFPGTEGERVDMPSAFVTFSKGGKSLGTYMVSTAFDNDKPQEVNVDGKRFEVALRFRRHYKPYTVTLSKFTHDVFPGTETARNFASEIRLEDPTRHVDRQIKIWMNHPLRFAGETFYQQSFANNDRTSILQVVDNPGFWMPYVACAMGALGMVIHFGMNLADFLRKKLASDNDNQFLIAALIIISPIVGVAAWMADRHAERRNPIANGAPRRKTNSGSREDRYTLTPEPRWATVGLPAAIVGICLIFVIGRTFPAGRSSSPYDWAAFGGLPIQFEGRTQPLDSWARNNLSIVGGRQMVRDEKGEDLPDVSPEQWLLETMCASGDWDKYKVIRIDHPEIKQQLGLPITDKYFSWSDVFKNPDNGRILDEQARHASEADAKERDSYQNQIMELHQRLGIFLRLRQVDAIAYEYTLITHPDQVREMFAQVSSAIATVDPGLMARMQSGGEDIRKEFNDALQRLDSSKLTAEQRQAVGQFIDQSERTGILRRLGPAEELYLAAPIKAGEQWQPLSSAVRETDGKEPPASADAFLKIINDFTHQRPADFNADVASYQSRLQNAIPAQMAKVDYETFFNHFDPFMICLVFYVFIFLLAVGSWMIARRPLARTAYWLLVLTFIVHTFGIISRIYISGRPPVTNLYSASVFIGWGIVAFSLALELIFRNGIAMVAAAGAGFGTMFLAFGLSSVDGDTMKQLQAVLDTNFWLGTHVVCVTMGYTATGFAGALSIVIVLLGVFTPVLTKAVAKEASRMVYGILCFAMLFSFVGTILGGIWADQSWGRFWGWDPKENGAVLVVLWNALILHARWGGLVKERGVMVLAILGTIVTAWSFFGTNMLGIGLHSYGFMESAEFRLTAFCFSMLVLAGIGMIPMRLWASFAETEKPAGKLAAAAR